MKWPLAFGFVAAFLVLGLGGDVGAAFQQSQQQTPQRTATSSELEQRDQPVTNDDLRIPLKAEELLKDESVWVRIPSTPPTTTISEGRTSRLRREPACEQAGGSVRPDLSGTSLTLRWRTAQC